MKNIQETNGTLVKMSANIKLAKEVRNASVKSAIDLTIEFSQENKEVFSTKKNAISTFIKSMLGDATVDAYTKRAVKVAKTILVDGYKMKKELLTISQMEQLAKFKKETVNELMDLEEEFYIDAVKELINSAKVIKNTKVFNGTKASKI